MRYAAFFYISFALRTNRSRLDHLQKILYQHVFPTLKEQMKSQDMLVHVFPSCLALIDHATQDEYKTKLFPGLKKIFCMPKPVQVTVADRKAHCQSFAGSGVGAGY